MPYKFEREKTRLPRELDRRVKLTDAQRDHIHTLYADGVAIRAIAREFDGVVSRRTIQHVLFPERANPAHLRAARLAAQRARYTKERRRVAAQEHRRYKQKVLKEREAA